MYSTFKQNVKTVIDKHFNFSDSYEPPLNDTVMNYANKVFSLGLFLQEFIDAVHEGDGGRILRCWKLCYCYLKVPIKSSTQLKF